LDSRKNLLVVFMRKELGRRENISKNLGKELPNKIQVVAADESEYLTTSLILINFYNHSLITT
jgi:hypothetical protein